MKQTHQTQGLVQSKMQRSCDATRGLNGPKPTPNLMGYKVRDKCNGISNVATITTLNLQ